MNTSCMPDIVIISSPSTVVFVPSWLRDHHLGAPFVKFTPQTLRVQRDSRIVTQHLLRLHGLGQPLADLDVMAEKRCLQPGGRGGPLCDIRGRQRPEKRRRIGGVEIGWWVKGSGPMGAEGMVAMHNSLWTVIQLDAASLKEWNSFQAAQENRWYPRARNRLRCKFKNLRQYEGKSDAEWRRYHQCAPVTLAHYFAQGGGRGFKSLD